MKRMNALPNYATPFKSCLVRLVKRRRVNHALGRSPALAETLLNDAGSTLRRSGIFIARAEEIAVAPIGVSSNCDPQREALENVHKRKTDRSYIDAAPPELTRFFAQISIKIWLLRSGYRSSGHPLPQSFTTQRPPPYLGSHRQPGYGLDGIFYEIQL